MEINALELIVIALLMTGQAANILRLVPKYMRLLHKARACGRRFSASNRRPPDAIEVSLFFYCEAYAAGYREDCEIRAFVKEAIKSAKAKSQSY
jgi:hypothetical protein